MPPLMQQFSLSPMRISSLGRADGQRLEQHGVDQREDGRSGANSQRQREDGGDGKAGRFEKLPQGVANVFKHRGANTPGLRLPD